MKTDRHRGTPSRGLMLAGLGLLASWLVVRAKARQAERAHPPAGKFITVDGVRLHYLERGEGPALVLLHGNGLDATDWDTSGVLDAAAAHYRVIAFDRPGFGYSERPHGTVWTADRQARLLHHALQALRVESAIVAGHSWGAMVGLALGLQVPDFVRGLVLVAGYYYPHLRPDLMVAAPVALPLVGDAMRYTLAPFAGRAMWQASIRRAFAPLPVSADFGQHSPWMSLRPGQLRANAAESALLVPSAASLARRYRRLAVPVQILAGTQDGLCECGRHAERLHGALRHSELALSPGVGHMLHHAEPGKVLAAIDAIAARVGEPVHLPDAQTTALAAASTSGV